eukprot:Blabericola_migrator_1__4448@NODE_2381_length_2849_cov_419_265996_g1491_i0_p1_GENE_NODE_2381_length_2849_cov_419_265996_g1491_i0NODE_2381_length_2849_cov_419_265996_g1491_i0_p1_ORF_typecomplete_len571_score90_74PGM_PMM_I/PF02878_16/3_4e09PGM_PMM_I/PF02878_16/2_2e09PGM_PMM_III/PF02880_16/4_2e12PGM_PMM_IV/PF00408_20/9_4e02PGM_PMM_IV/PF00408_20/5_4e09PGM_PMM_II/PF02879_16/0_25_NODE_2381_length_2849_cov_419_265996_g1491_i09382650
MEHLKEAFANSPRCPKSPLNYGTAGFRSKAELLPHAMFRCGVLAALRSLSHGGQAVGVCVTASHNPEHDNGVKIVEPDGGMLKVEWEKYSTDLVNCGDDDYLGVLDGICIEVFRKTLDETLQSARATRPLVIVARDTRSSSPELCRLVVRGIRCVGGFIIDCEEATTPMLHWAVTYVNDRLGPQAAQSVTPQMLHKAYYEHFTEQLREVLADSDVDPSTMPKVKAYCDAAAGVGGACIPHFGPAFELLNVELEVFNVKPGDDVKLNDHCGAEHVQKGRELPRGADKLPEGSHCFSLDGDADRVVFFLTPSKSKPFRLLDGDRIAALGAATFLKLWEHLAPKLPKDAPPFTVGVVQTAYANGGSTKFLRELADKVQSPLNMSVCIAKTGVKNVHKLAVLYDIGIWFESNGHGTIATKFKKVDAWAADIGVSELREWKAVRAFLGAYNWCVGDAMVDALCFELCLRILGISLDDAYEYYQDLHVVQAKKHMSRSKLDLLHAHPEHEMWLVSPTELQDKINAALATAGHQSRAFVRASGTEDVCRIYAEADNVEAAQQVAQALQGILDDFDRA